MTQDKLLKLRKFKTAFYLGPVKWKKEFGEGWESKTKKLQKSNYTYSKNRKTTHDGDKMTFSKKYDLFRDDTDAYVMTITDETMKQMMKSGIKILSEKNGFAF